MSYQFNRWSNYHGRISVQSGDVGHEAHTSLTAAGYRIRVMWNGKELSNVLMADSNNGEAVVGIISGFGVTPETKRGTIEILIAKWGTK